MVYLTKREEKIILKELSENSSKEIQSIVNKIKNPRKQVYVRGKLEINRLLKKAFKEKRSVKIKYYSPHSDESTARIVDIYIIHDNGITTYCHLRKEERFFRIDRISSATILDEKYKIPKNWKSENIILDK